MKEQGVDFDHIAQTYDESSASVQSMSSSSEEVNLYDLGDDFNEQEDEFEQDSESFLAPSCKAPVPILKLDNIYSTRADTPNLKTAETEGKESDKALKVPLKVQSNSSILFFIENFIDFDIQKNS